MTCSKGTCQPPIISCWHAGEALVHDERLVPFVLNSYGMWTWKIAETYALTYAPGVGNWMRGRRKAKRKRQRAREEGKRECLTP